MLIDRNLPSLKGKNVIVTYGLIISNILGVKATDHAMSNSFIMKTQLFFWAYYKEPFISVSFISSSLEHGHE